jgi:hypothetical protein
MTQRSSRHNISDLPERGLSVRDKTMLKNAVNYWLEKRGRGELDLANPMFQVHEELHQKNFNPL